MKKRQENKNKKRAKQLIPISPYDQEIKADKKKWLAQVEKIVETENLASPLPKGMIFFKKKKLKKIRKQKKERVKQKSLKKQPEIKQSVTEQKNQFLVNPDDFPPIGEKK